MTTDNIPASVKDIPKLLNLIHSHQLCYHCCIGLNLIAGQSQYDELIYGQSTSDKYCMICLGLLQNIDQILTAIVDKVYTDSSKFDTNDSFLLELVLPRIIAYRRTLFTQAFNYPWINKDWQVKKSLNLLLLPKLALALNRVHSIDAPLHLYINMMHDLNCELPYTRTLIVKEPNTKEEKCTPEPDESGHSKASARRAQKQKSGDPIDFTRLKSVTTLSRIKQVSVRRDPIYIGGRYLKLERGIAQTKWIVNGIRLAEFSVGECIGDPFMQNTGASDYNLVGAGREDADVRMLGKGRPFYLELQDPTCTNIDPVRIADQINQQWFGKVQVSAVQQVSKADCKHIKLGAEMKPKTYVCLVWANKPSPEMIRVANSSRELEIHQATPTRVLHRRPNLVREKMVYEILMTLCKDHFYTVQIKAQAGTYIKEFIHGDFGRTSPSLRDLLGVDVDILELDVLDIDLEWPPALSSTTET